MDRHCEPRRETDAWVEVTLLGDNPVTSIGRVVNRSGRGMRLILDHPLPRNAPIRVEWDETLIVGEVCYNAQQGDTYAIGLLLEQGPDPGAEVAG